VVCIVTYQQHLNLLQGKRDDLPVAIITPTIAEITVAEMAKTATDTAPIYTATTQAKKIAKNPPAAANDIRTETMTALAVATSRKNMKMRRPVNAMSVVLPTCHIRSRRRQDN
jgi:hypothetical protein